MFRLCAIAKLAGFWDSFRMRLVKWILVPAVLLFVSGALAVYLGNDALLRYEDKNPSTIALVDGKEVVRNAKRLPSYGPNFETYSLSLSTLGRTHVHSRLRPVILSAYALLEKRAPGIGFIYGETGWKNGGRLWPHRTHRNGLSVDFMVPVRSKATGKPAKLALSPLNKYGYSLRFDKKGLHGDYLIDFEAVLQHLKALKERALASSLRVKRVILDPPLLDILRKQSGFDAIADIEFMKGEAWFPHDSHYHVDFEIRS